MAVLNLKVPTITMALPGTQVCITIDAKTLEAVVALGAMGFILVAGTTGLITGAQFYSLGGVFLGYIATKFFGISGSGQ